MKNKHILTGILAAALLSGGTGTAYATMIVPALPQQTEMSAAADADLGESVGKTAVQSAEEQENGSVPSAMQTKNVTSSPVVGAGSSSQSGGPGVSGSGGPGAAGSTVQLTELPGRIDYFTEQVKNPVVAVTEKYSYDRMVQDIGRLKARYGDLMQVREIGTSLDGRQIYEVILGNPDAKKHVLIHAGIHGREYMTPLLAMKQLEYGLEFYGRGSYEGQPLSNILNQAAVHFVPMVNPDGISLSQFGLQAIRSAGLQQTIRQCYADDLAQGRTSADFDTYLTLWKSNARGVDLNQNYPAQWEKVDSCPNPSYGTYKGEAPLSEPENQALANLVSQRTWAVTISYHSMGNVIYWDYETSRVRQQSQELAALVSASNGNRLAESSGHGGFKDWTQIKDSPIPGLTIEMGSVPCPLPLSEYQDLWHRNKMIWALAAKYAMDH